MKMKLVWKRTSLTVCLARATPFALPVACLLTLLFMSAGAQEHAEEKRTRRAWSDPANTAAARPDGGQIPAARQPPPDGARLRGPGRLRGSNGRRPQRSTGERQGSGRDLADHLAGRRKQAVLRPRRAAQPFSGQQSHRAGRSPAQRGIARPEHPSDASKTTPSSCADE